MIKLVLGYALLLLGAFFLITSTVGLFRFPSVLTRLHATAVGDTGGIFCVLAGLMVLRGISVASGKMLLVLIFVWLTGPVAAHLLARMELRVNPRARKECGQETEEDDPCGGEGDDEL